MQQIALRTFLDRPTHVQTALLWDTTEHALASKVPTPILAQTGVEYKLQGAPLTYLRSAHPEMIKTLMSDGKDYSWPVPGYEGVTANFTVEYDFSTAVQEERTKADAKAEARAAQDVAVDGRKVKLFGDSCFDSQTATLEVKHALHRSMTDITKQYGGAMDTIWNEESIVSMEAGRGSSKKGAQNGDSSRVFFVILANKAAAEWLVATTKFGPRTRLQFNGRAVQAHICRPRRTKNTDNSHTVRRGAASRTASTRQPLRQQPNDRATQRATVASHCSARSNMTPTPTIAATTTGRWAAAVNSMGASASRSPAAAPAADAERAPSTASTTLPTADTTTREQPRVNEENVSHTHTAQLKKVEQQFKAKLAKMRTEMQTEINQQIATIRTEMEASVSALSAMLSKQVKAQQDIMKESIQKLSQEIGLQQKTSFSEFSLKQEAAFSSLPAMIAKAVEEALSPRPILTKRKRETDASTEAAKLQHTNPSGDEEDNLEMTEEEVPDGATAPTTLVPPPAGDAGGGAAN
jgi:hypothetical protein